MGAWQSVEDSWYGFLDWTEKHGIPLYKAADFFENRHIPSLPAFLALILILVLGIGGFLYFYSNAQVVVQVSQDNAGVQGLDVTLSTDTSSQTLQTDAEGKAIFSVPFNSKVTVSLQSDSFEADPVSQTVNESPYTITLNASQGAKFLSKRFQFVSGSSTALFAKAFTATFTCSQNSNYSKTVTISNGEVILDDIPKDCATVYVSVQGYGVKTNSFSASDETSQVQLQDALSGNAKVLVFIKDDAGKALSGINVSLKNAGGMVSKSGYSNSTGSVVFESIAAGTYSAEAVDSDGAYIAPPSPLQNADDGNTLSIEIAMHKAPTGKISLQLSDGEKGTAIEGAEVLLYKGGTPYGPAQYSDLQGSVDFKVAEDVPFSLTIDHPLYWKKSLDNVRVSNSAINIALSPYDPALGNALNIHVVDEQGFPIESANVRLKKGDGTIAGSDQSTGADGNVEFERVEPGSYFVQVSKASVQEKTSALFQVRERQLNSVTVPVSIGFGNVSVTVQNEDGTPITGAQVQAIDVFFKQTVVEGAETDSAGQKTFAVRADHTVFLKVSATGYATGHSIAISPVKDDTQRVSVSLSKDVSKFELQFLGLSAQGNSVQSLSTESPSVSPGQSYTAKFRLKVPQNANYKQAIAHIRTDSKAGDAENKLVEQDYWFVRKVLAPTTDITLGSQYSSPNGVADDSEHFVQENGKWANVSFSNLEGGTYEILADIVVRDSAVRGSVLELRYRTQASSGGVQRNPVDAVLGNSENVSTKQGVYAETKAQLYTVGASTLCSDNYCGLTTITDLTSSIDTSVLNDYPASVSGNYRLNFLIAYKGSASIVGTTLKVSNAENGLNIGNYLVKTAQGQNLQGTSNSAELALELGSLSTDSTISGSADFSAEKEGVSQLNIELISGNQKAFSRTINVSVASAKQLSLSISPKTLVPYIDNALTVIATDADSGSTLANVALSFSLDNVSVGTKITAANGSASLKLNAPSKGSVLKIEARKEGYQTATLLQTISEQILSFQPTNLQQTLTVNGAAEKEQSLTVSNETPIPLTVKSVSSSDLKGLVQLNIDRNLGGETIDANKELETVFIISLTDKGKALEKTTTLEGTIDFEVFNPDFGTWVSQVPLKVSVGFGGEADNENCLTLDPSEWKIVSSGSDAVSSLTVKNNCKVDGESIALSNLQAKISFGNESEIGSVEASSDFSSTKATLSNSYTTIADSVGAGSEGTLTLNFKPSNIASGISTPIIYVKAVNKTQDGDQELVQKIKTSLSVNNLSSCLNVKADKLTVETSPFNTGNNFASQNNFAAQRNYNPNLVAQYPWNTPSLPGIYDQYNFQAGAANAIAWPSASALFSIENNCQSDVDVSLNPDNALVVNDTSFTLKSSESRKVKVEAGFKIGQFPLTIEAKASGSTERSKEIKSLSILVRSASEVNQDCISLSNQSIRYNDFLQRPVTEHVYNDCFDQGVRLGDQIRLQQYSPQAQFSSPSLGGQAMVVGKTLTSGGKNGGQREVLDFIIQNDYSYRSQPGLQTNSPFQQFGNIRYLFQGGIFNASSPAQLTVYYSAPGGQTAPATFKVTLQDNWNFLQLYNPLTRGNPNLTDFQDCVIPEGITIKADNAWFALHSDSKSADATTGTVVVRVIHASSEYCGGSDALSDLQPSIKNLDNGGQVRFEIDGQNRLAVKVTITRPITPNYFAQYNDTLKANLSRTQVAGMRPVSIPANITVCNGENCASTGGEGIPQLCNETDKTFLTSESALPKTKLDWKFSTFSKEPYACDAVNKDAIYCDGTQFSLELASKAARIQPVIDLLRAKTYIKESITIDGTKTETSFEQDATQFYRFAFQQVKVVDSVSGDTYVFFVGKDGTLLNQTVDSELKSSADPIVKSIIEQSTTPDSENIRKPDSKKVHDNAKSIIQFGLQLLEIVKNNGQNGNFIIEIDDWDKATANAILKNLKVQKVDIATNQSKYVMTFNEFQSLNQALSDSSCNLDTATCSVKVQLFDTVSGAKKDVQFNVTATDLSDITTRAHFKLGVRNHAGDLSKNEIDPLLKQGKPTIVFPPNASPLTFNTLVNFDATLMVDGYNQSFFKDFKNAYKDEVKLSDKVPALDSWTVNNAPTVPGTYGVKVKYAWTDSDSKNDKIVVDLLQKAAVPKENDSIFYRLPFDGRVGQGSARNGYGVVFAGIANTPFSLTANGIDALGWNSWNGTGANGKVFAKVFDGTFGTSKTGTILDISNNAFRYSPSMKVNVTLNYTPSSNGFAFVLNAGGQQVPNGIGLFDGEQPLAGHPTARVLSSQFSTRTVTTAVPISNSASISIVDEASRFSGQSIHSSSTSVNQFGTPYPYTGTATLTLYDNQYSSQHNLQFWFDQITKKYACIQQTSETAKIVWKEVQFYKAGSSITIAQPQTNQGYNTPQPQSYPGFMNDQYNQGFLSYSNSNGRNQAYWGQQGVPNNSIFGSSMNNNYWQNNQPGAFSSPYNVFQGPQSSPYFGGFR